MNAVNNGAVGGRDIGRLPYFSCTGWYELQYRARQRVVHDS